MGYDWKKGMSSRAVKAYASGLKPASKWSRELKIPSKLIAEYVTPDERHHTSKFFNETAFYSEGEILEVFGLAVRLESAEIFGKDFDFAETKAVEALRIARG